MSARLLVSACLLGEKVRYDGGDKHCGDAILARWLREGRVVAVCPELAGGLPVPRPPAEIAGGAGGAEVLAGRVKVVEDNGRDVSAAFVRGAEAALALARAQEIRVAVLKEGSPSCGSASIHDGSFSGRLVGGAGVTAELLRRAGIAVLSEHRLAEADALLAALDRVQDTAQRDNGAG